MDKRLEFIFNQEMKGDTSFTEKPSGLSSLFGGTKYTQSEMKDTWNSGIKKGIEIGLRRASLEGQKIENYHNITNPRHKEFLDKFHQLAEEYQMAITHHPEHGMSVIDMKRTIVY